MDPKDFETLKKAAGHLEASLKSIEHLLESINNRPVFQATGSLMEALRHLHDADPTLLSSQNRERVENLIQKSKAKTGRDSFNTGF